MMKKLLLLLSLILGLSSLNAQEATFITQPVNPSRLFSIPTTETMHSLSILVVGGGMFGIERERSLLGNISIGFGEISEIGFSTASIIDALKQKSASLPTSSMKMKIIRENGMIPNVSWMVTKSLWIERQSAVTTYKTRMGHLYLILSKGLGPIKVIGGLENADIRIEYSNQGNTIEDRWQFYKPIFGITIDANPKTKAMFEFRTLPSINYDSLNTEAVYAGVIGIRFFFTDWVSLDAGFKYQSNYQGPADAVLKVGINAALPISKLFVQEGSK